MTRTGWGQTILLALVGAAASAALGKLELALQWHFAVWATICFALSWTNTQRARIVWFNIGAIVLISGVAEVYVRAERPEPERRQEFSNGEGTFVRDPEMGHRPAANFSTGTTLHFGDELVYDVVFTTDEHALRVHPPETEDTPLDCVLFFGCSYMFGEGVEDDQTIPYYTSTLTGGRFRVRNFGYSGYGPHHMLAAIETGLVERAAADCDPKFAVYQSHPHHVLRASGKWWWDRYGPNFVADPTHGVVRRGTFEDSSTIPDWMKEILDDSSVAMHIRDGIQPDENDVDLLHRIVARSRQLLNERYPGLEFHIVHWDVGEPNLYGDGWDGEATTIHPISTMIDFDQPDWVERYLLPHDVHPTAETQALIADYVVREILRADRD